MRRRLVTVFGFRPSPPRLHVAIKAAITMALPMSVALLAGRPDLIMACGPGAFTVLYGPASPARFRLKLMGSAGLGFVAAAALGAVTAGSALLGLAAMVVTAVVATIVCAALKIGPPGAYFFPLVVGIAGYQTAHGVPAALVVAGVMVGATVAVVVGMADLVLNPRAAEQAAIAAAGRAIAAYQTDADARVRASAALHAAWDAVNDGAATSRLSPQREQLASALVGLHQAYVTRTGELAGADLALAPRLAPERVIPSSIDLAELRETSLGRPGAARLLDDAVHWPSEPALAALRVGIAGALAGLLAMGLDVGHSYWAVAFAVLVLANVGSRRAQLLKAVHRFLGTCVGLLIFFALSLLEPTGWWLVVLLGVLQFGIEMLVVRNYGYAVALITPLALTISTVASPQADAAGFLRDRGIDTLIGLGAAVLVVLIVGRRTPPALARAAIRQTMHAVGPVLASLAAGQWDSASAKRARRHLHHELLEGRGTIRRANADDADAIAGLLPSWAQISELGYLVLGACWHPGLRADAGRFALANALFARLDADPAPARVAEVRAALGQAEASGSVG